MELKLTPQQSQEQQIRPNYESTARQSMIVGVAVEMIREYVREKHCHDRSLGTDTALEGLSAELTYRLAPRLLQMDTHMRRNAETLTHDSLVDFLVQTLPQDISNEYQKWNCDRHEWKATHRIQRHRATMHEDLCRLLKQIDVHFAHSTQDDFERIRSATYRAMHLDDLPQIQEIYSEAAITSADVRLLLDGKTSKFQNASRHRPFVYDWDEPAGENLSVGEQMRRDLSRKNDSRDAKYEGRVLEATDGKILAWLTYHQTPDRPNGAWRQRMRQYLLRGVNGAKLRYQESDVKTHFLEHADQGAIQIFDTIQGNVSSQHADEGTPSQKVVQKERRVSAAARLFAKATGEMIQSNENLRYLMAYRLYWLFVNEPLYPKDIYPGSNQRIESFFDKREINFFAEDRNPDGPRAMRMVDGKPVTLRPAWAHMFGEFDTLYPESKYIWNHTQKRHGDFSDDNLK